MKGYEDFRCDCGPLARAVCVDVPFYGEYEGKLYCVFHYPGRNKSKEFRRAFQEKLQAEDFNFREVRFPDAVDLSNIEFTIPVNFADATFMAEVRLIKTTFISEADFSGARFDNEANFTGARFTEAYFRRTRFAVTNFAEARFSKTAEFNRARFGDANFEDSIFNDGADFSFTRFSRVSFSRSTINGALFVCARFGTAEFYWATFNRAVMFYRSKFSQRAAFAGVTFKESAVFNRVIFSEDAEFSSNTFEDEATFEDSQFFGELNFERSIFQERVSYIGSEDTLTGLNTVSLNLQFSRFCKPESVYFRSLTLRPSCFVDVDAREFSFAHINWEFAHAEEELLVLENRIILSRPYHRLLAVACQNLAHNAEENHRYEEASKFRYLAMDAKRLETWRGFGLWRLSWWYWLASGYGESVVRALAVLISILVICAAAYTRVGFLRWEPRVGNQSDLATATRDEVGTPLPFGRALTYSAAVALLQKPEPRPATFLAQCVVIFEIIVGPLQIALLALAIRRKFMR